MSETENISSFGEALCLTCLTPLNKCDQTAVKCSSVLSAPDRVALVNKVMTACSIKLFNHWENAEIEMCTLCIGELDGMLAFLEKCAKAELALQQNLVPVVLKQEDVVEVKLEVDSDDWTGFEDGDNIPLSRLRQDIRTDSSRKRKHCRERGKIVENDAPPLLELGSSYDCDKCGLQLLNMDSYRAHFTTNHLAKKNWGHRKYSCSMCPKTFTKTTILRDHVSSIHTGVMRFVCQCGRGFSRRRKLEEHIALAHENRDISPQYACDQCAKAFRTRQSLNNHMNMHLGVKPFLCSVCGAAFTSQSNLKGHFLRMHEAREHVKSHLCDTCGEAFYRASHMKRHKLRRHTDNLDKTHQCPVCGKRFLEKSDLTCHVKLHEDVKPHVCATCGKCFRNPWQLRGHVNRIHLGIRPFECNTCGSKFKMMSHLKKHVRTHTGEKPYPCPHCTYSCAEKSNLKKHINIHLKAR